MTIYEKYTAKRKKLKGGYYTITYDENGKKIGQEKWHGTNVKGESPKEENKKVSVKKFNQKLAKKETPYKQWKKDGYSIGKRITYTDKNMRFPFSYEVEIKGIGDLDEEVIKWVTVQARTPMTKEEIIEKIKKLMIADYHFKKVKTIKVENLILSKEEVYQDSYEIPSKPLKKNRRKNNASSS